MTTSHPPTSGIPEPGRQAAHVLIDAASVWDWEDDASNDTWSDRANLALDRLHDTGAVVARFDEGTNALDLDLSGLLGGAVVAIHWLVGHLSATAGVEQSEVYSRLRAFIDYDAVWEPGSLIP